MKLSKPHTLAEIAAIVDCRFVGDAHHVVSGINEIHRVVPGDITFVDHPKYVEKCLNSAATTIITNDETLTPPAGKALIFSANPFESYNFLAKFFMPFEPSTQAISPSATIGEGTLLQPGVVVGNHAVIGKNCILHANVVVYDYSVIGDNCIIHSNSVIGGDAFYVKKTETGYQRWHSIGRAVIEDDVEIGSCCTIDRGVSSDTIIGKGSKLDNQIHVGHDSIIGKNCLFAAQVGIAGVVDIEDDVILWGQVGVSKDLTIGRGAVVYAQSGVPKSLDAGKVYFGSPVGEAKHKMRELAAAQYLPELIRRMKEQE
ncbi:MAG: UDP-3-O-(3-hydroxymyristoyl)glucosamine N-acyltransferase [Sphingobacteriales bacterium JAD_PAG50586_3]|nr:MAG: UDP-3-O-(3-hydroxymyristoyl)glucosamine N-acyltransferase [Sphingobacteriales bacterium JAD_PAG50586_3]